MPADKQRPIETLVALAITVTIVVVLYWAQSIFIPIALAGFLTFVLGPLVAWLQRRRLGRTLSVLIVVSVVMTVIGGIAAIITHEVVTIASTLPNRKDAIKDKIISAKEWVLGGETNRFGQMLDDIDKALFPNRKQAEEPVVVESNKPPLTSQLQPFLTPSMEFLGQAALTFVLTVYMLIRREDLRNRMIRLLGSGRVTTTTKAVDEASRRISRYLLMQLCINCTFGLIISAGLLMLGVKYVILWGFLAALMRYIPYIGTWIGLIPVLLFTFATAPAWGGGWGQPICVLALYCCLELITGNVVEPVVYGSSMGLSEVAQLIAAAFWSFLWGPIGLILSAPMTACLLILGKYVRGLEFIEVLLGDEPALDPKIAFYQRLAAHDQDEAEQVAAKVAKESSPDNALDTVVIPALSLVRRDFQEGEVDENTFNYAIHATREVAAELEELREPSGAGEVGHRVRVLISPARDQAEQTAADILGATLDEQRWEVRMAGDQTLASELVTMVEEFQPVVIVLVTLPPGGLAHCRYLVSRVRSKFPKVRIIVARWGADEDNAAEEASNTVEASGLKRVDGVDRTIIETRKRLNALHPVLLTEIEKLDAETDLAKPTGEQPALAH
jgi:predicted PurR-regulated permease PerM